jgi:hypothetical protein
MSRLGTSEATVLGAYALNHFQEKNPARQNLRDWKFLGLAAGYKNRQHTEPLIAAGNPILR